MQSRFTIFLILHILSKTKRENILTNVTEIDEIQLKYIDRIYIKNQIKSKKNLSLILKKSVTNSICIFFYY